MAHIASTPLQARHPAVSMDQSPVGAPPGRRGDSAALRAPSAQQKPDVSEVNLNEMRITYNVYDFFVILSV